MNVRRLWRLLPFLLFIILIVFLWRGLALDPHKLPSVKIGKKLPDFTLPVLKTGEQRPLTEKFTKKDMYGQVSLLNIWASWCDACVDEQLFLMQLKKKGIPIFGINYKDDAESASQWLKKWGNPYKIIGKDEDGKLGMDLGVYGTPETFLVDAKGIIRYRHVGVLDENVWQENFILRIRELNEAHKVHK